MGDDFRVGALVRGLVGAAVGGAIGHFAFGWFVRQGFYAMILPGATLGAGFSALSRDRATGYGVVCAVLAVGLGLFTEWRFLPFVKDGSFTYFIGHIHELKPVSLLMIGLGGVFGYWFGVGRRTAPREGEAAPVIEGPPGDSSAGTR
ncbi:MAG: hypothetical protein DWQ34_05305 [Planctomycetota bacterium]|nr:MAG: hypothetical protein DWQ29_20970 [Planctomycetota bacterium]REJ95848.1 MAG: hypothetical protein DWQ34_05305 [Planctomycetota bacterium]REK25539.1 MAG: hypothetical protein DWQ41_11380 [Planctomycetota bacterium]REK31749.1 MAG: hypothetical protein DWQ45_19305 [Planctomycetota bacterium]